MCRINMCEKNCGKPANAGKSAWKINEALQNQWKQQVLRTKEKQTSFGLSTKNIYSKS